MRAIVKVSVLAAVLYGCGSDNNNGNGNDLSVPDSGVGDGGSDGMMSCGAGGASCTTAAQCCSGMCDPTMHICSLAMCGAAGAPCSSASDCCGLQCTAGYCAASMCVADGQNCTSNGACCSNICGTNGTCTPLNNTCKTAGNPCPNGDGDCCNHLCINGQCAAPSQVSYCTQVGDICAHDSDCCTDVCKLAAGATVGTCQAVTSGCAVDGTTCAGCTGCCSSLCAPFGSSGSSICQPASGCHVQGDLCTKDSDCCGGDATVIGTIPGAGLVKCVPDPTHPGIGTCSNPVASNCPPGQSCGNSCVPEGDVCHFLGNGGCSSNSTRNDCCACINGKDCCKLDPAGIPRCNSISTCVPAGGACADSADCCNNEPCVPDSMGHLHCGMMCIPMGGICTTTADCCTGFTCVVPPGMLQGTCDNLPPPPTDGGTPNPDQGACALEFQACSSTTPCCNGITCRGPIGSGSQPCGATEKDCTCYEPIP